MKPSEYCRMACEKAGASHVYCFVCVTWDALPCSKWFSCERGVMKRNEGRNERSGVKDTVAAGRNERNCKQHDKLRSEVAPEGHCRCSNTMKVYKKIYCCCCNGLAWLLADDEWRTPIYRRSVGFVRWEKKRWLAASRSGIQGWLRDAAVGAPEQDVECRKATDWMGESSGGNGANETKWRRYCRQYGIIPVSLSKA